MSIYEVDKVLREMILHPEACDRYQSDPNGYLEGRNLDETERRALLNVDYVTLYSRGAHPFLLWGWTARMHQGDKRELMATYRAAIAPYGYPDFAT